MGQISKRSLMKMGNGGLVISVPVGWVRYYGLAAGDKVEVVSNGKLTICPAKKGQKNGK